jgi:transposase
LAAWWHAGRIATVAMQSTGVSGIPVYEMLEARGFPVPLVNARHLKPVPGRQTDGQDCPWRQSWHPGGLRSASFRPDADMCALRASWRHRATWLDSRAAHIQPMQKALPQMNGPLPPVRTAITGTPGRAIIRALVAGERAPVHLARCREPRWAHRSEDMAKALTGPERAEPGFALPPALAWSDVYTAPGREGDADIARPCHAITPVWDDDWPPLDRQDKALSPSKKAPAYEARRLLSQLTGVDWVAIPGRHASTGQRMSAESGLDLGKWPTEKAFCAWLGLAPRHEIAGGNVLRRSTLQPRNRAGQAWRCAAPAAGRSPSGLGAFDRRMRARLGPTSAMVATAPKIARIRDHLLTHRTAFRELSPEAYRQQIRARELAAMRKKAARLGLTLVESQVGATDV